MKNNDTKMQIVDSMFQLMKTQALDTIFVKDIALSAHITRQTFYRHFKDRYAVINWFYDQKVESLFVQTNTLKGIHTNLVKKCDFYKLHINHFKNAYSSNGQNSLKDYEFSTIYNSLSRMITTNASFSQNEIPHHLRFSIEFYSHGIIGMTINWVNNECPFDSITFADKLLELMPTTIKSLINEK